MKKSILLKHKVRCSLRDKIYMYYTCKSYEDGHIMYNKKFDIYDYIGFDYSHYDIENFLNNEIKLFDLMGS